MIETGTESTAVCNGARAAEVAEAYLLGDLPVFEMERFEEHYFGCPACFAHLQALQSVQQELASRPSSAAASPARLRRRLLALGAIAAAVTAAIISFQRAKESPAPAHLQPATIAEQAAPAPLTPPAAVTAQKHVANVASLADLSLPLYKASSLRGGEVESAFQVGMRAYAAGNCPGALRQLKSVPAEDENAVAARLYAGACELFAHKTTAASGDFEKVIAVGNTPQLEAACYYLAQAMLLDGNVKAARSRLAKTIALCGDFERRARAQLTRLANEA